MKYKIMSNEKGVLLYKLKNQLFCNTPFLKRAFFKVHGHLEIVKSNKYLYLKKFNRLEITKSNKYLYFNKFSQMIIQNSKSNLYYIQV